MKITLFLTTVCMLLCCSGTNPSKRSKEDVAPQRIPLADPYILLHEGIYYAYGTFAENGIAAWTSTNLKSWKRAKGLAPEDLVMHRRDVWGNYWFWAPEVYHRNGKFYLYYSAEEHICAAVSDSPLGPFRQEVKQPMIADEKCIDNTLFVDDDGRAYMFFDRFNDGLNIWMVELNDDWVTPKMETLHPCIHVSQPWEEIWPRVNEGAFVIKHDGCYHMIYSANSYESPYYGIGCATTKTLNGEWEKYKDNPLLQNPDGLRGVGHGSLFRDKEGNLRLAFHAHHSPTEIHPRFMYLTTVRFNDGKMVIDPEYTIPLFYQ